MCVRTNILYETKLSGNHQKSDNLQPRYFWPCSILTCVGIQFESLRERIYIIILMHEFLV